MSALRLDARVGGQRTSLDATLPQVHLRRLDDGREALEAAHGSLFLPIDYAPLKDAPCEPPPCGLFAFAFAGRERQFLAALAGDLDIAGARANVLADAPTFG